MAKFHLNLVDFFTVQLFDNFYYLNAPKNEIHFFPREASYYFVLKKGSETLKDGYFYFFNHRPCLYFFTRFFLLLPKQPLVSILRLFGTLEHPTNIYLFKVKKTLENGVKYVKYTIDITLVSLQLKLNIFRTFFSVFIVDIEQVNICFQVVFHISLYICDETPKMAFSASKFCFKHMDQNLIR